MGAIGGEPASPDRPDENKGHALRSSVPRHLPRPPSVSPAESIHRPEIVPGTRHDSASCTILALWLRLEASSGYVMRSIQEDSRHSPMFRHGYTTAAGITGKRRRPKPGGQRSLARKIGRERVSRLGDCQHHGGREPQFGKRWLRGDRLGFRFFSGKVGNHQGDMRRRTAARRAGARGAGGYNDGAEDRACRCATIFARRSIRRPRGRAFTARGRP